MAQASRVLFLPPGVVAAPPPPPQPTSIPGLPFDRAFFEHGLPQSVQAYCAQIDCGGEPVVEVLTVDGTTHFVKGISGVSEQWVALHTVHPEHEHDIQVFVPYQTIFRVAVHPAEDDGRRRLGFALDSHGRAPTPPEPQAP